MPDTKETKDARLNIRIEPSLKEAIQDAAKSENRTLANYVTHVLQEAINEKQRQKYWEK